MAKIGLESIISTKLTVETSITDSWLVPVLENQASKPKLVTVGNLNSGGILDSDNVFSGSNNFTGTLQINSASISASAAELNKNDISAQSETIDSGTAVSVTVKNTKIDNTTSGAGAITLAAPDASMYGLVKTIEMTVDNGDVTLALTNVQGGSAATTATFADVNDTLILVGGTSKWHVIGESGVVLS